MDAFEKNRNMLQYITNSRMSPNLVAIACPFPLLFALFRKGFSQVKVWYLSNCIHGWRLSLI